ncbi:MAG: ACT domain-containing protein [Gammaproteobacteria bacterium]|nr:ACT domain-containing protein [Gammaproteobacteria bacterium]
MKQITIISPNRPGVMADISETLAQAGININHIDAETFNESAIIIMNVDNYDRALYELQKFPDLKAVSEDAIVIRIENKPGALAQISTRFKNANINIRSIRFLERDEDYGLVAISTERTEEAMQLVNDVLVA